MVSDYRRWALTQSVNSRNRQYPPLTTKHLLKCEGISLVGYMYTKNGSKQTRQCNGLTTKFAMHFSFCTLCKRSILVENLCGAAKSIFLKSFIFSSLQRPWTGEVVGLFLDLIAHFLAFLKRPQKVVKTQEFCADGFPKWTCISYLTMTSKSISDRMIKAKQDWNLFA